VAATTIQFFSDQPNGTPAGTDLFILQRGASYINSSFSQVRSTLFYYPSFQGDGYIPGQWHVGNGLWLEHGIYSGDGSGITNVGGFATYVTNFFTTNLFATTITNVSLITSNVLIQFPGGSTNLNLIPKAVMYSDINDAETSIPNKRGALTNDASGNVGWYDHFLPDLNGNGTNETFYGATHFDEIDVPNAFLTNIFGNGAGITNSTYQYVTNNSGSTTLSWGLAYRTNLAADVTVSLASTTGSSTAPFYQTTIYWVTNNSGSNHKVTSPSGVIGPVGSGTPSVLWATNNTVTRYLYEHYGASDIVVSKTDFGP
jgi:hypothetical protein